MAMLGPWPYSLSVLVSPWPAANVKHEQRRKDLIKTGAARLLQQIYMALHGGGHGITENEQSQGALRKTKAR